MLKYKNISHSKLIVVLSILIIAIIKTFECSLYDTNIGSILIKDGMYLANEFKILLTNKNNLKTDSKTKICVIATINDYENNCKPFTKIYYDKWVLIINIIFSIYLKKKFTLNKRKY